MTRTLWAAQFRSVNQLDGEQTHLIQYPGCGALRVHLFASRREARDWIAKHYGYLRERSDLRAEPHGWRMPRPVKVEVSVRLVG